MFPDDQSYAQFYGLSLSTFDDKMFLKTDRVQQNLQLECSTSREA